MRPSSNSITGTPLSLGAFVLALCACTVTPRGSQNSYKGQEGKLEIERIEGNKTLAARLQIHNPIEKTVDGRKVAQFELKNTHSDAKSFAWAVDWFDADGFRISDVTRVFEPVKLGGYGSTYITITAPKAGEHFSWKLVVTDPNEVH